MTGLPSTMRAWVVSGRGGERGRLVEVERAGARARHPTRCWCACCACGVCRTDLHLADGDLPAAAPPRVPGHEVVGEVVARGRAAAGSASATGSASRGCGVPAAGCRPCRRGGRTSVARSEYTGWDADGGFAEYAVVAGGLRLPPAG